VITPNNKVCLLCATKKWQEVKTYLKNGDKVIYVIFPVSEATAAQTMSILGVI
jgi:hypothetical protein